MTRRVSDGAVHKAPKDVRKAIASSAEISAAWEDITSLARNEWICWVASAKRAGTRAGRIRRMCEELANGKRRPCCWPGCPHR